MINTALLWYLLIPLFFSIVTIFILHKFLIFQNLNTVAGAWKETLVFCGGGLLISTIILSASFYIGRGVRMHDDEIMNGQVLSKSRVEGSYIESYQCNCTEETSGYGKNATTTTVCQTCYRNHYTVDWSCASNIGSFNIKYDDWLSSSVYNEPSPQRWIEIKKGDPVSRDVSYVNYIKAVPSTIFRPAGDSLKQKFAGKIPAYPDHIYDIYKVNRVLAEGVNIPNLALWNKDLSNVLKTLGPQKQANAVIVLTSYDSSYYYALQDAWLNGKKNDIILVVGLDKYPGPAKWVKVMALTTDDMFQVKLRDDILGLSTITPETVIPALQAETLATFHRKRMHDFSYLKAEIDPPQWVMTTDVILISLSYIGFWIFALFSETRKPVRKRPNIYNY